MRKVNEENYESFSIVGNGWQFKVYSWQKAKAEWHNMKYGTLYGNKPDGSKVIIDSK